MCPSDSHPRRIHFDIDTMAGLTKFGGVAAALRQRNFAYYLWGGTPSVVGLWVHRIAVLWLTWEMTKSGTWLGLMSFADLAPTVIITPFAGAIADRVDRRKMSIITQALAMLQAIVLAVLVMTGLIGIWSLWVCTLFLGCVYAFFTAARLTMVPNLLPREHIPAAIALDSAIFNVARFLGPMVAGAIIIGWGVGPAFVFNACTFVIYLYALFRLRLLRDESSGRAHGGILQQTVEGLRYAWDHAGIRLMLLVIAAMALGVKPVLDLLPGFADVVFNRGPAGLAELTAAAGLGAFSAAVYLATRGATLGLTKVTIWALAMGATGILVFCANDIYWLALVAMFFVGASVTLAGTGTQTLMQAAVDGAMRGRVMSLYGVIYRGGPALGALVMGTASDTIGLPLAVSGGGVLTLAAWLWIVRRRSATARALEDAPK